MTSGRLWPALIGAGLMTACLLAMGSAAQAAGGASAVDDSDVGAAGSCKVESWASFGQNGDVIGTVAPGCVVPLWRPVEFGAQVQRTSIDGAWATGAAVKAKTNLIPSGPGAVGLGVVGGLTFDLVAGEYTGAFAYIPATLALTDTFKVSVNAGWLGDRVSGLNWLTYGAGFEWNFVKPVTLLAEVFGQTGNRFDPASVTDPRFQAGLRFTPAEALDIDIFYGRNIVGEGRNWVTVGLNYRFDIPAFRKR